MLEMRPGCECCDRDLPARTPEKLATHPASTLRVFKPMACARAGQQAAS